MSGAPDKPIEITAEDSGKKYGVEMAPFKLQAQVDNGLNAYYDYDEALAISKKEKKPLLLAFTGVAYVSSRKFENEIWGNKEIIDRMKNDFIVALLYADASEIMLPKAEWHLSKKGDSIKSLGDKNTCLQIDCFQSNSIPAYYFIDYSGGYLFNKAIGYPTKPNEFIIAMNAALMKFRELHP